MKLSTYLMFEGNCREAFTHYEKALGGKMLAMMDHRGTPAEEQVPPAWRDKILHACLEIDGQMLMASDAPPDRSDGPMRSVSVSVGVKTPEEAERIFAGLSEGGAKVAMPMSETFWSPRFGMLICIAPKPPMPHICGSTTPWLKAQAMAASTALPPRRRISAPTSAASGWAATIIPRITPSPSQVSLSGARS